MTTAPLPEKPRKRSVKKTKPVMVEEPVVKEEPVVEEPVVEEPVVEEPVVKEEPVVEEPVVEEPVTVEEPVVETVLDQINSVKDTVSNITRELKNLEVDIKKIFIAAKKQLKKKTKKTTKSNSNHGFNAEVLISDELAEFLGVEKGSKMRPPQVFSKVNEYAKENDCKDPTNKSIFKCDKKLSKLLGEPIHLLRKDSPELGNGVSNFNINKYLNKHYTKIE